MHVNSLPQLSPLIILNASSTLYHGSYLQHLQPLGHSWERRAEDTLIFFRLLPQDLGSDRAQRTSPEAAALPPSPAEEGLDSQADLQSLCPPLFVLSACSASSFSPIYRQQQSWAIIGHWDADVFLASTFCLWVSVSVLPFSVQRHGSGHCCRQPKPASQTQREQPGC